MSVLAARPTILRPAELRKHKRSCASQMPIEIVARHTTSAANAAAGFSLGFNPTAVGVVSGITPDLLAQVAGVAQMHRTLGKFPRNRPHAHRYRACGYCKSAL